MSNRSLLVIISIATENARSMTELPPIAKLIDHALLHPIMTDEQLLVGCDLADRYQVATVCVKPCWVRTAATRLENSLVGVGTVIGFPHGVNTSSVKALEAQAACDEGAAELDMVANLGWAFSGQWSAVADDIRSVLEVARSYKAILKVIVETDYHSNDEVKIQFCKTVSEVGADFIKTSTGFGFVKQSSGDYNYAGATAHDVQLMRRFSSDEVQVKASGGIRSYADARQMQTLGATRIGTSSTAAIVEQSGSGEGY